MLPTETLEQEHRVIEKVLNALAAAASKLEQGETVRTEVFSQFVDFIRSFADSCHHGKEEDNLFPALEERGVPKEGPIGVMLLEHDQGRSFVKGMDEAAKKYAAGDKAASGAIVENARGYINLLSQHIPKEDNILYPLANRALSDEDQRELSRRFEAVEQERIGEKHSYYEELADKLKREFPD